MNYFTPKISKFTALLTLCCLLLPLFTLSITATPSGESSLIWNGGVSQSFEGTGTHSNPYLIQSGEDLALLASNVRDGNDYAGKYFTLCNNILLNDIASYSIWNQTPPQQQWTPIGGYAPFTVNSAAEFEDAVSKYNGLYIRSNNSYQTATAYTAGTVYYRLTRFNGTLNGNGHTIGGLYVSHTESPAGLFGVLGNATIQDLTLTSTYVTGNIRAGVLAGTIDANQSAKISKVRVEGTLVATERVGGIIGYVEASGTGRINLTDCSFSGTITGNTNVGGILGKTGTGSGSVVLSGCTANASIYGSTNVGGILGHLTGAGDQITDCKSDSSIFGTSYIGGIVGAAEPAIGSLTISNCQNNGILLTDHTTGGIVGGAVTTTDSSSIDILNCRNIGEIYSGTSAGGILGKAQQNGADSTLRLQGCKNSASIQGTESIGGIIGYALIENGIFTVNACENYGTLSAAEDSAGGIIGECQSDSRVIITMCSVRATIQSKASYAGGIAGKLIAKSGTILLETSGATGTVYANVAAGGIAGHVVAELQGSSATIQNCIAANSLSAVESLGGIAGHLLADRGAVAVNSSLFAGNISSGCKLHGGISANLQATQTVASAMISNCYYSQSSSSSATHLAGGSGDEKITSTEERSDEAIRNNETLNNLDPQIWQSPPDHKHAPTPAELPLVWEDFSYTVTQSGAILLAYLGRSDIVRIPDRLGGISVSTISDSAFRASNVIRIICPDTITAIGESAFANCSDLERITLPSSLISIGARAFSECTSLSEIRCSSLLSTVLIGSENEPYQALAIIRPITMPIDHLYEDGSSAGKSTSITCYAGDYYSIEPLSIKGYKADAASLCGVANSNDRISVIYRIGTYHLTIRYLFSNGIEAAPSYEGDFRYGDKYSISTPILEGFKAEYTLVEGLMEGNDLELIVHYTEIFENDSADDQYTLQIILLILSGLICVCCLCYFIYRYRSVTEQAKFEDN